MSKALKLTKDRKCEKEHNANELKEMNAKN